MTLAVTYTVFNDMVVKENRGGVESFYMSDTLGSTSQLVDPSGNVTNTFTYWPYGEIRTRTGTTNTPYTFVGTLGYYLDTVMNWFYVRARYYLPNVGRWLTVDPLWPKHSSYLYSDGSPVDFIDPTGLQKTNGLLTSPGTGQNYGPCVVYECTEHTIPGLGRLLPSHKYVCVASKTGGCAGGIGPGGGIKATPTDTDAPCPGRRKGYYTTCEPILVGCDAAAAACKCIRNNFKNPGLYIIPFRDCFTYPTDVYQCTCEAIGWPERCNKFSGWQTA